jgi:hypothetical protein
MSISFISSMKYGAQMNMSANTSLFTSASNSTTLDLGGSDPTLELLKIEGTLNAAQAEALNKSLANKLNAVYKPANIPVAAKFNGGRNTTAPQLIDYFNARTKNGAKVYSDPEASFKLAVENFGNEESLQVIPSNGMAVLTSTQISSSASAGYIDIGLIPGKKNQYRASPGSDSLQCIPAFDKNGKTLSCVVGGDFVIPICPGNVSTLLANPILSKTTRANNIITTMRWHK